jgi:hypothetical protein
VEQCLPLDYLLKMEKEHEFLCLDRG